MKTSTTLRNICIIAIKKSTIKPYDFKFTKFYENEQIENISDINLSDFLFEEDELPILSVFQSQTNWWLLTTHKIVIKTFENKGFFKKATNTKIILFGDIIGVKWNDYKGLRNQNIEQISIQVGGNSFEGLFIETGRASMIPINGLMKIFPNYTKVLG